MKNKQVILNDKLNANKVLLQSQDFFEKSLLQSITANDAEAVDLLFNLNPELCKAIPDHMLFCVLTNAIKSDESLDLIKILINKINSKIIKYKEAKTGATLLETAVSFGNIQAVKFLLSKDADVNNQDLRKQTPLLTAVQLEKKDMVELLVEYKAKIGCESVEMISAFHLAVLLQNTAIEKILVNKNPEILRQKFYGLNHTQGLSYIELKKFAATSGIGSAIKAKVPKFEKPVFENLNQYKAIANYCKGLLANANKEKFFTESINYFKNEVNNNLKKGKVLKAETTEVVYKSLHFLEKIYTFFKTDQSENLKEYIIAKCELAKFYDLLSVFYTVICSETLEKGDYLTAFKWAELAHTKHQLFEKTNKNPYFTKEQLNYAKHEIYYNLGFCIKNFDSLKALEWFEKALKAMPGDEQTLASIIEILFIRRHEDGGESKLQKMLDSIKDQDFKTLLELNLTLQNFQSLHEIKQKLKGHNFERFGNGESLKQTSAKKYALFNHIKLSLLLQDKEYDKAIEIYSLIVDKAIQGEIANLPDCLLKLLQIYQQANWWNEGLEYLKSFHNKFPDFEKNNTYIPLKYYEFLIYQATNQKQKTKECLEFLKSYSNLGEFALSTLVKATHICLYDAIGEGDYSESKIHIEALRELGLNPFFASLLINRLEISTKQHEESAKSLKPFSEIPSQDLETINEQVASLNWLENTTDKEEELSDFSNLDPKAIHHYFQAKKQNLLKEKLTALEKQENIFFWNYLGNNYSSADEAIYPVNGKDNFYATISPKLIEHLSSTQIGQFTTALTKGKAAKAHGSNGIKFLDLIKLKINEDLRLYTTKVCLNDKGKYLIVFDRKGKHEKISKLSQTSKVKVKLSGDNYTNISGNEEYFGQESSVSMNYKSGTDHVVSMIGENYREFFDEYGLDN